MGKLITFLAGAVTGAIGIGIAAFLADKDSHSSIDETPMDNDSQNTQQSTSTEQEDPIMATNERMARHNNENSSFFKDYTSNNSKINTVENEKTERHPKETVHTNYATNA